VAEDWPTELRRFREKVEAGAHFAFTQPLYRIEPLERCLEAIRDIRIPVFLGLLPLMSYRHAWFMHNEVPGIIVPDDDLAMIKKAEDRGAEVGIEICRGLLDRAKGLVEGVYLMPSFGRYETCLDVIKGFVETTSSNALSGSTIQDHVRT